MTYFDDEAARRMEAMYATQGMVNRRRVVVDALQVKAGERVVDIGTGSGFVAYDIADAIGPTGEVVGVDLSEPMMRLGRLRCADKPWVRFEMGEATQLPFPDNAFDAAVSVQVFEYVREVDTALGEMFRVLRPGGRAAIVSTDWKSIIWHSSDAGRMQRILAAYAEHCVYADLPRTLGVKLKSAGFNVGHESVITQYHRNNDPSVFSHYLIDRIRGFAPGRQGVSGQEAADWADDLQKIGERGGYFFCLNQFLFVVVKPLREQ
jgi:ubiquinone/menaquinone biosynthesis C-methylase UbiE